MFFTVYGFREYFGLAIATFWSIGLLTYVLRTRVLAFRGNKNAANRSILDMYVKVIVADALVQFTRSIALTQLVPGEERYGHFKRKFWSSFFMALVIAGLRSGFTLGILFYLTSPSPGKSVITKSLWISFLFCILTTGLIAMSFYNGVVYETKSSLYLSTTFDVLHFFMYIYFILKICDRSRSLERLYYFGGRIRYLLGSRIICIAFFLVGDGMFFAKYNSRTAYMMYAVGDYWSFMTEPILLYLVLVEDSQYWRFLGSKLANSGSSKNRPVQRFIRDHIISVSHERLTFSALECLGVDIFDFTRVKFRSIIGKGSHGTVRRVSVQKIGDLAAKEVFFQGDLLAWEIEIFCREAFVSRNFNHPNIVKFYGICVHPPCLYLLYELCNCGNLRDFLFSRTVSGSVRYEFVRQATCAVHYIHENHYVHRDIKTENFLLQRKTGTRAYTLKLADFGTTRQHNYDSEGERSKMKVFTGTLLYMAPELLKHFPQSMRAKDMDKSLHVYYDYKADIFGLAVTVWEIVSQTTAYHTEKFENGRDFRECVIEQGKRPSLDHLSGTLWEVVLAQNFKTNPEERMDTEKLLTYFQEHRAKLKLELDGSRTLLQSDQKRISALKTRSDNISLR